MVEMEFESSFGLSCYVMACYRVVRICCEDPCNQFNKHILGTGPVWQTEHGGQREKENTLKSVLIKVAIYTREYRTTLD